VQPAKNFLADAGVPQAPTPPAPPAPPAPGVVKYYYDGREFDKQVLLNSGWTEAQIATLQIVDEVPF